MQSIMGLVTGSSPATDIVAGSEKFLPNRAWLDPVSVTYAYVPSGEKVSPIRSRR